MCTRCAWQKNHAAHSLDNAVHAFVRCALVDTAPLAHTALLWTFGVAKSASDSPSQQQLAIFALIPVTCWCLHGLILFRRTWFAAHRDLILSVTRVCEVAFASYAGAMVGLMKPLASSISATAGIIFG